MAFPLRVSMGMSMNVVVRVPNVIVQVRMCTVCHCLSAAELIPTTGRLTSVVIVRNHRRQSEAQHIQRCREPSLLSMKTSHTDLPTNEQPFPAPELFPDDP